MTNEWYLSSNVILVKLWDGRNRRIVVAQVSPEDLPTLQAVKTTWYALFARKSKTKMYANGKLWLPDEKRMVSILMHRVIMGITDPLVEVDHRDNDGLNNQRGNLRLCTHMENMRFRQPTKDWVERDRRSTVADEYRQERAIARAVAAAYGLTRQALWKIRMQPGIQSPASRAYRAAIETAGIRPLDVLAGVERKEDGKFGLFRSGGALR